MRRTILAAALVVGCGSGTPDTPPASSGGCKSSLCSSGSGAAGVKWQVLSVDGNVKGGAAPHLPSGSPIPGLRANSIRQSLALGLRHSCALPSAGGAICWA